MEKVVDLKLVIGFFVFYALLIYFGGMATRKINLPQDITEINYENVI